jgi:hypothetical protein
MLSAISYLNPFADKHTLRDFHRMQGWEKVNTVFITLLEALVIMAWGYRTGRLAACVSLPAAGFCAVATFRALVALTAPRNPPPAAKNETASPAAARPPERTARDIMKGHCANKIRENLQSTEQLGTAVDNGDCFYDAIAQLLRQKGIAVSVKDLREVVGISLAEPRWQSHIEAEIKKDPRGLGDFKEYSLLVLYDHSRIEGSGFPAPIWGHPSREGVILCDKYKFKLRVLKAGLIDGAVEGDERLNQIRRNRDIVLGRLDEDTATYETLSRKYGSELQARYRELYDNRDVYFFEEEIVPKNGLYPNTLTLALFGDHFVPVFTQ